MKCILNEVMQLSPLVYLSVSNGIIQKEVPYFSNIL